jgi:hypothetical protein
MPMIGDVMQSRYNKTVILIVDTWSDFYEAARFKFVILYPDNKIDKQTFPAGSVHESARVSEHFENYRVL